MFARVFSTAVVGVEAVSVEVEVNNAPSNENKNSIVVVGLPDAAVRESRDRVTTAIRNSGLRWPDGYTLVNLAPADLATTLGRRESFQILHESFLDTAKHSGREL